MNPTGTTMQSSAATAGETRPGELHGDRLIAGLWIAMALALGRALLQAMVDWTADHEIGARLAEHFLEHLVDATGRVWIAVPVLAIVPRGRTVWTALLRAVVAFSLSVALLAGWPDGELRYQPGTDSTRGWQGWGAIAAIAIAIVILDRYATSPHRRLLFGDKPAARFVVSAAVLLLGGGAIATVAYVIDRRRLNMEVEDIVLDLLDELPHAKLTPGAGDRVAESGSLVADKGDSIAGGNKPSLVVPVGGEVEFTVDLPRYTSLSFSYGVDRYSVRPKREISLTFAVAVDDHEVLAEKLEPQSRQGDRGWVDRRVELTVHEERNARIALRLRGSGDDLKDVRAGFGRPLLVRREWRPRVAADPAHMNVVLVVVDSLRPDHLGCYGATRPVSPSIDRLASESIVYDDAESPSSWTWPAVASLFTGLWPPSHGVTGFDRCYLSDSLTTIAERFAQDGCTTLGVTASPFISHTKNFQQGFGGIL